MSARRRTLYLAAALITILAIWINSPVRAAALARWTADPLHVEPAIVRTGVTLPGDLQPFECASHWDLTQPLGLAYAANIALCSNPAVTATWEAIKEEAAAVGTAESAYLPSLSASYTQQHERNQYPAAPQLDGVMNGHSSYAALSWRVYDFGARAAAANAARLTLAAALASHDAQLQETLDATVQAYFDAITARSVWIASLRAADAARETVAATMRRERGGVASHNDWLQAQVTLDKSLFTAQQDVGALNKSLATLVYALGLPAGTRLTLPNPPAPTAGNLGELQAWLTAAERQQPAIIAARKQWHAAIAEVASVRAQGLPTVDFGVNFYQNGYPNEGIQATSLRQTTFGLTVTIPIFEGFSRTYQIESARAASSVAEAQYRNIEHQTLMLLVQAYAEAVAAFNNLSTSDSLLDASTAALDSSRRRYAHGAASIIELLQAQENSADAAQQRVQTIAAWDAARLRLLTAAGMLGLRSLQ
jgi:outer membrane protein